MLNTTRLKRLRQLLEQTPLIINFTHKGERSEGSIYLEDEKLVSLKSGFDPDKVAEQAKQFVTAG